MAKDKFITRIGNAMEQAILSRVKNSNLYNEYHGRTKNRVNYEKQAMLFKKKEISDWTMAIMSATDPDNPRRGELMRFYQTCRTDLHLDSCVDARILPVQCAAYKLVDQSGNENEDAHKLLEKPWFLDLIRLVLMSTFEGTKLIELFETNDYGEVKQVTEVPQSNFLAHKGIVIDNEGDDNGTSYKEGKWKNYYIQVGGDYQLGILMPIGLIVLAKKLGLGSWLSYIEKFGVPPIFAITERMDPTRRDELFEMLTNFRQSHFAVLQGNEKIEIPNNYNVDAYKSFDALNKYSDDLMSKKILGGTATVDEKSFVGSAKVHEKMFGYRNQVDKLLFKFYFNEEIKPRLVSLSSVYAPLANLTFEFDETETLTLKEKIELIKELSQYYEFDIEEIARITDLPITAVKSAVDGGSGEDPQKKKSKPNASVKTKIPQASYNLFAEIWNKAIEEMAENLYNGSVKPQDLNEKMVLNHYKEFAGEANTAWGKGYYESATTRKLRENLIQFSGAKCHALMSNIKALAQLNITKEQFLERAKKAVTIHNETYMATEKKFVANSASSARDFESYMDDVDIYPYLKNRTMNDDSVTPDHALNDGVIKPLHEWKRIPPYRPGCRCWLEQTVEPPTLDRNMENINEIWATNPVMSGRIFLDEHSYFEGISSKELPTVRNNTEALKLQVPYSHTIKAGKQKIHVSDFYDETDFEANLEAAKAVAEEIKEDIYIRPHLYIRGKKNPELSISDTDTVADLKTFNPAKSTSVRNFIKNSITSANKQKCKCVVLDLTEANEGDVLRKAADKLRGDLSDKSSSNSSINRVILKRGEDVLSITREQINSKNYLEFFTLD